MSAPAWLFVILTLVTVAALGIYLIRIIFILKHVSFTVGTIVAGVRAIANQTELVTSTITNVNNNLTPVYNLANQLGARFGGRR